MDITMNVSREKVNMAKMLTLYYQQQVLLTYDEIYL